MIHSSNDSQELIVSTKERHVLGLWFNAASDCIAVLNREITCGDVARHMGQSRNTAKKYLNRLVGEGALVSKKVVFKNGTEGLAYEHIS